jgi:predicted  nucleic acid-binding Zn-ribbon protein
MTTVIKTAATSQQQVRAPTRELDKAERRDELLDSELDTVTGGVSDLGKYITKAVDDAISASIGSTLK